MLSFRSSAAGDADCLAYQRESFLAANSDEVLVELSAYAAKDLSVNVPRDVHLESRVARIRELIETHNRAFVFCYGTSRRPAFESLVGYGAYPAGPESWRGLSGCLEIHFSIKAWSQAQIASKELADAFTPRWKLRPIP